MALATAKQCAGLVLLCVILELIMEIVTFQNFGAYRCDSMSRIDVDLYARKVGFSLLHIDNYCGHMITVRPFCAYIFDSMSWTFVHAFAGQTLLPWCRVIR